MNWNFLSEVLESTNATLWNKRIQDINNTLIFKIKCKRSKHKLLHSKSAQIYVWDELIVNPLFRIIRVQFPITILKYLCANIDNPVETSFYIYVSLFPLYLQRAYSHSCLIKFKSTAGNICEIWCKDLS